MSETNDTSRVRNSIQVDGNEKVVNDTTVNILLQDEDKNIIICNGTTVPDADAGYAKGCIFIKTNAGSGVKSVYENQGTTSSCSFNLIGDITTAEINDGAITSDKMDVGLIKFADVEIEASAIKTLKATPVSIVPATEAGAGYAIIPFAVLVRVEAGTEVLTESDDNLSLKYSGSTEVMEIETTGLIDQLTDQNRYQEKAEAVMTPIENTAIVIANSGSGEFAGNASDDAKLYVRAYYRVVPVL